MSEEDYKIAYENVMIANKMLEKENKRLNNIINEFEQWLEEAIETISHISLDGASGLDMALKKIKELKGVDKE